MVSSVRTSSTASRPRSTGDPVTIQPTRLACGDRMNSVTPKEVTTRRGNALRSIKLLSYEITAAFDLLFVSAIVLGPLAPWFYARLRITVVTNLEDSSETRLETKA